MTPSASPADHRMRPPVQAAEKKWRWMFVAMTAAYYLALMVWPRLMLTLGIDHSMGWFLDSYAILASNDAAAAGLDPWGVNPLDPLSRPHVYSGWWLGLGALGLTRADNFLLGGLFVAAFFAAALWWLRPKTAGEAAWYFSVVAAPPVVLGVERGNNDLIVFAMLTAVVPMVLSGRRWVRWAAALPLLAAAGLKFYPAVGGVVLLMGRERREVFARAGIAFAGLVLLFIHLQEDLRAIGGNLPRPGGVMTFGAGHVFRYYAPGMGNYATTGAGVATGVLLLGVIRPWRWLRGWVLKPEWRREWGLFILGAVLLTGCFFTGASYAYRLVFCVMMAPLIWKMAGDREAPAGSRTLAWSVGGLMAVILWDSAFIIGALLAMADRLTEEQLVLWADRLAIVDEPLAWAFFICLAGFLGRFAGDAWRLWRAGDI